MNFDVKASVTNLRESKNAFKSGFRPVFEIHSKYMTSGEIQFIDTEWLGFNESAQAYIAFITPEVYPKTLWVGKRIVFREGVKISGEAVILEVLNKELISEDKCEEPLKTIIPKGCKKL